MSLHSQSNPPTLPTAHTQVDFASGYSAGLCICWPFPCTNTDHAFPLGKSSPRTWQTRGALTQRTRSNADKYWLGQAVPLDLTDNLTLRDWVLANWVSLSGCQHLSWSKPTFLAASYVPFRKPPQRKEPPENNNMCLERNLVINDRKHSMGGPGRCLLKSSHGGSGIVA